MFIVWEKSPVKGRGGGPFLASDSGDQPEYAPPWQGLRCEHHGGGRSEWTPLVVQPVRRDGQLRQKLIYRLPPIRSCCIENDFYRAAWWHDVDWAIKLWGDLDDGPLHDELARDQSVLLAQLRQVIRKPSPAGIRNFGDFRSERDAEDAERDRANHAYWTERVRQIQEHDRVERKQRSPDCFAALGLRPSATLNQVKARHREHVKLHHPDRGGDPAKFRAIQEAYERALAVLEARSAH